MKKTETNDMLTTQPAFLRAEAASQYLGISKRCLNDWKKQGIVSYSKMGRKCVLFKREDLDKAVGRFTVQAVDVS